MMRRTTLVSSTPRAETARVRRALSMIEIVISTVIVGVMLVAALQTVAVARGGQARVANRNTGVLLAQDLMAEILRLAYADPEPSGRVFGPETTETLGRAVFDDVDDYVDWTESPPTGRDGVALPGYTDWSRKVKVVFADPNSLQPAANQPAKGASPLGLDTGMKRITVTVSCRSVPVVEMTAICTAAWAPPGLGSETISLPLVTSPIQQGDPAAVELPAQALGAGPP